MMNKSDAPEKYDGFYFLPIIDDEEEGFDFKYFSVTEKNASHEPIENTKLGDKYHICLLKTSKMNNPEFDCSFEAILGDPVGYIMNLTGHGVYGAIIRKTKTSGKWFETYLTNIKLRMYNKKVTNMLKSILGDKINESK